MFCLFIIEGNGNTTQATYVFMTSTPVVHYLVSFPSLTSSFLCSGKMSFIVLGGIGQVLLQVQIEDECQCLQTNHSSTSVLLDLRTVFPKGWLKARRSVLRGLRPVRGS